MLSYLRSMELTLTAALTQIAIVALAKQKQNGV